MTKRLLTLAVFMFCLAGLIPASAFKDIKIDLTNGNLLTADEIANQTVVEFGVAIGDDGTATRVDAGDASANITLKGKFHSNEHGWGNFSATVAVEGPVKVSMGSCAWGGDVTVTNAAGEQVAKFNTNTGACYHNNKAENIASAYYKGDDATTLTISGGNYTPYIAVEYADPSEIVEEFTVSFDLGDSQAEGVAPESAKVELGSSYTIPANHTLYLAGSTLTGWSDGTTTYAVGDAMTVTADTKLTPVFTTNSVALADRTEAVTLNFDFQRNNGAPTLAYQNKTGIYVTQAIVNGQSIDVKLDFDTNNGGKIANAAWGDWCQMNGGTKLTVPSCKGAVVSIESYSATTTTTIDGQTDYTASGNVVTYTIASTTETIDIVIGDGSYFRYIKIEMPVVSKPVAEKTYTNEPASVIWNFNNTSDYDQASSIIPEDGFTSTSVNLGDIELNGTGTGQATDADGNTVTFVKLKPSGSTQSVQWTVKPSKGFTFTPTKVSAYIQRFGTDVQNGVVVTALLADGTSETLGTYTAPRSNRAQADDKYGSNDNYTNQFVIELTEDQQKKFASTDGFTLQAAVGVGSAKQGGFSDVRIEGLLNGSLINVNKYTLSATASPEEGGEVTIYPKDDEYDEGTEVKLTAAKNFGYKFINWTDSTGNEVSTDASFTYTVNSNAKLTANFEKLNTYSLTVNIEGGGKDYMVTWAPEPTNVDGKSMYEEGTTVSLTASSNKIIDFTNWSNGETSMSISVDMNQDQELTANFSAKDYIVAWDFVNAGSDGRPADFAAADNDAVTLVLRNEAGSTSGWLDKSLKGGGPYEGRNAAVNWRTTGLGDYYWQTCINASAFTDIKVASSMTYNYNSYTKHDLQYSLDGETWTTVGSFNIAGAKNWADEEFSLPSDANNKSEVYLRWKADKTSTIDGATSNNDGASLADIYITGTAKLIDDGTAPVLVSTVPAEGNDNASANGKIILTFDEKVMVGDDVKATLGDNELAPSVSGKTVLFEYKGLEYSTPYTFTLPAGSVSDLTGNAINEAIVINFSTKTRPTIAKGMFDFVVPDDGTFKEAIAAADARTDKSVRYRIFVKRGNYLLPYSETETITNNGVTLPSPITYLNSSNVSIIGEDMDETVVKNDMKDLTESGTSYPIEGLHNVTTLYIQKKVTNTYIQDITLKNGMNDATGRGEAIEDCGDKTICKDVCLHGYQDTYCSNNQSGRAYFEGGRLRGRTDFLCGKGDVYYNGVELVMCQAGGYIAVPSTPRKYGYIFKDCVITGEGSDIDGRYTLGRPWGSGTPIALYIDTRMDVKPSAVGWNEMGTGWPARFAEYNSTTSTGTVISLADRKKTFGDGHANDPVLTAAEAAQLTLANVMGDGDDWDPTEATEQASAPKNVKLADTQLTWDNSDYVLCWAVCKDGNVVAFTTEPTYTVDDTNATYSVRAANEMGGLGDATVAESVTTGISTVATQGKATNTKFYNLNGIRTSKSAKGVNIKVETLDNGKTTVSKVVK